MNSKKLDLGPGLSMFWWASHGFPSLLAFIFLPFFFFLEILSEIKRGEIHRREGWPATSGMSRSPSKPSAPPAPPQSASLVPLRSAPQTLTLIPNPNLCDLGKIFQNSLVPNFESSQVCDLRLLVAAERRLPADRLKLVLRGQTLHDKNGDEDALIRLEDGGTLSSLRAVFIRLGC